MTVASDAMTENLAAAPEEPAPHVLADVVGAEERLAEGGELGATPTKSVGPCGAKKRSDDRDEHQQDDEREADPRPPQPSAVR